MKNGMKKTVVMVGRSGMAAQVSECFVKELFRVNEVIREKTIEDLLSRPRTGLVTFVVVSVDSLSTAIEERLALIAGLYPESDISCFSEFPVADEISIRCKRAGGRYLAFDIDTDTDRERFEASVDLGHPYYPNSIARLDAHAEDEILAREEPLTERQHQVLRCELLGMTIKETAYALSIAQKTVVAHRARYAAKLEWGAGTNKFANAISKNLISPYEVFRSLKGSE